MRHPVVFLFTALIALASASRSYATLKIQKQAKDAGFPATTCLYCHNEKLPAKGKVTHNERGTFLIQRKEEKKATEIDVAWLKEFVETKK